jgi:hypothetical protein
MSGPTIVTPNQMYLRSPSFGHAELVVVVWGDSPRIYRLEKRKALAMRAKLNEICDNWPDGSE